ncbi:MAG: TrbI/VirB10 family protein [Alphaproteobacteria bacterium]|nr:TrbI/VirB10 family protein [Alphaproteobacteria bacterium]MDE2352841.1 TrbI/VirB10 family protein [Alphaproteobacteria bacterium]
MPETGAAPPDLKLAPESFALRAEPRPVVRFKRNLLIAIAAIGSLGIFGAAAFALRGPDAIDHAAGNAVPHVNRKPAPDELSALPSRYDQIKLGPPLPGDLGVSVVAREKSLGLSPADGSPRPNPTDAASEADAMRLVQQARQADESGVLFRISRAAGPRAPVPSSTANQSGEGSPVPAAAQGSADTDSALALDPSRDPNAQGRKLRFVSQKTDADIYNPHALQQPLSPYEILAGTIIPASLITGLNSDLPGLVVAQVTENVFDTVTGMILLIPQGSRLIGSYDSVVAFGQSRALVVWQRIIMPDGSSIQIDNLPATDAQGYSGLEDDVDYHTWTLLKGIALSTLLGVGTQASFGSNNSNLVEAIRQSTQESTNQAGQRMVEKDLDIQPTITIRPGWPLNVVAHQDLILKPYKE